MEIIQSCIGTNKGLHLIKSYQSFNLHAVKEADLSASLRRLVVIPVAPSIRGSEEVSPMVVTEGSFITLLCESSGIPPPNLTWMKDGKSVSETSHCKREWNVLVCLNFLTNNCFLDILGYTLKPKQRIRVLSGGRQLQISSAEKTDTGTYNCTASSAAGTTSKEYSLLVYGINSSHIKSCTNLFYKLHI